VNSRPGKVREPLGYRFPHPVPQPEEGVGPTPGISTVRRDHMDGSRGNRRRETSGAAAPPRSRTSYPLAVVETLQTYRLFAFETSNHGRESWPGWVSVMERVGDSCKGMARADASRCLKHDPDLALAWVGMRVCAGASRSRGVGWRWGVGTCLCVVGVGWSCLGWGCRGSLVCWVVWERVEICDRREKMGLE